MKAETKMYRLAAVARAEKEWAYEREERVLSERFWDAILVLLETWSEAKRDIHPAFVQRSLDHHFVRLQINQELFDNPSNHLDYPPAEWFAAFDSIMDIILNWPESHQREVVSLVPVAVMSQRGANNDQIAMAYGWIDANGFPQSSKVQEELESPGTHTKGYVHPREAHRQAMRIRIQNWVDEDRSLIETPSDDIEVDNADHLDVRTFSDCIEAGLTPEVAATMLGVDVSEAHEYYDSAAGGSEPSSDWAIGLSDEEIKERAKELSIAVGNKKRETLVGQINDHIRAASAEVER